MTLAGGDVLARGGKSAQFSTASNMTDFEADFLYQDVSEVLTKYGLSQAEYDQYAAQRLDNEKLPNLKPVSEQEELAVGFSVEDHRKNYMNVETTDVKSAAVEAKKFPEPEFEEFHPILDRILVMRISDDPEEEMLEDGSTKNRRTGLITASKYRQHSNVGIVLATGQHVVLSGLRLDMSEFVRVGDKITYGDYNSEVFLMDRKKAEAICDRLKINYVDDSKGIRIVRAQDVRGVEHKKVGDNPYLTDAFIRQKLEDLPTGECEVRND